MKMDKTGFSQNGMDLCSTPICGACAPVFVPRPYHFRGDLHGHDSGNPPSPAWRPGDGRLLSPVHKGPTKKPGASASAA